MESMEKFEKLLDVFRTAVHRRHQANANFSRCTDGEIENCLREERQARAAVIAEYERVKSQFQHHVEQTQEELKTLRVLVNDAQTAVQMADAYVNELKAERDRLTAENAKLREEHTGEKPNENR